MIEVKGDLQVPQIIAVICDRPGQLDIICKWGSCSLFLNVLCMLQSSEIVSYFALLRNTN